MTGRKAIVAALLVACISPQAAHADADPASDILPTQNVFYPYQQQIPSDLKGKLNGATAAAKKAGYPIKVAIIATPADLGGVPNLFGKPTEYAGFLGREISFNQKSQPLLVVMPAGLGTFQAGPRASEAISDIEVEDGAENLARAALEGVSKLAAAAGHPIKGFKPEDSGGGTSAVVFAIPVALLVIALAVISYRRAGRDDEEEEEEEETAAAG
ncbi:MAG TPA: hypothetical protein VJT75_15925 [Thermoleophilaceae bacterium]|nr:hypothetical protein [Thermoleophilaceae bacterium]